MSALEDIVIPDMVSAYQALKKGKKGTRFAVVKSRKPALVPPWVIIGKAGAVRQAIAGSRARAARETHQVTQVILGRVERREQTLVLVAADASEKAALKGWLQKAAPTLRKAAATHGESALTKLGALLRACAVAADGEDVEDTRPEASLEEDTISEEELAEIFGPDSAEVASAATALQSAFDELAERQLVAEAERRAAIRQQSEALLAAARTGEGIRDDYLALMRQQAHHPTAPLSIGDALEATDVIAQCAALMQEHRALIARIGILWDTPDEVPYPTKQATARRLRAQAADKLAEIQAALG